MEKICRICNTERRYDEYHKLYERCNKCNVRCSLNYCYANKDKELEKGKIYYHNNREKNIDLQKIDVTYIEMKKINIIKKFKN